MSAIPPDINIPVYPTDAAAAYVPPPEHPFGFQARGSELFVLYLKCILLTIVTLGIYSFWAKVVVKRYLMQRVHVYGRTLNYHATGRERFIAFLKGMVVLALFGGLLFGVGYGVYLVTSNVDIAIVVGQVLALLAFFLLRPAIIVGKARYELSRSSWSNVRFRFVGRIGPLFAITVKGILLTIVTFGIYLPWFTRDYYAYLVCNTQLGNQRFHYDGDGGELFWLYLKGILLSLITFGIGSFWFIAWTRRYHTSHCLFQGQRFRSTLEGSDVFANTLLCYVLIIFTLGIGLPWATVLWLNMEITNLRYCGLPDIDSIEGSFDEGASAFADGLSEAGEALSSLGDLLGG